MNPSRVWKIRSRIECNRFLQCPWHFTLLLLRLCRQADAWAEQCVYNPGTASTRKSRSPPGNSRLRNWASWSWRREIDGSYEGSRSTAVVPRTCSWPNISDSWRPRWGNRILSNVFVQQVEAPNPNVRVSRQALYYRQRRPPISSHAWPKHSILSHSHLVHRNLFGHRELRASINSPTYIGWIAGH